MPDPGAVGPNNAALRTQRGSDPLFTIPPAPHLFRRVRGLTFQVGAPGGIAPIANALPASLIAGVLSPALAIDVAVANHAGDSIVLLTGVLPAKWEQLIARLHAEPNIAMDPNATYDSPEHLACVVARLVARIVPGAVDPAYILLQADLYDFEPPAGVAAWVASLMQAPTGLTYSQLATASAGFMPALGFLEFVLFGRCLSAARDAPTSPFRQGLSEITALARVAQMLRNAADLTASVMIDWTERTTPPQALQLLRERGTGVDRREQLLRDRHHYAFGSPDQKSQLVTAWALSEPLSSELSNVRSVLRTGILPPDAQSALLRLARATTGSPRATLTDVGMLAQLDVALRQAVHTLSAPKFAASTVAERVDAVERSLGLQPKSAADGAGGAAAASGSGGQTVQSSRAALYSDETAQLLGDPRWHALIGQLDAELQLPDPNPLRLHDFLMASGFLGARRLALRLQDWSTAPLIANSKVMVKTLSAMRDFNEVASLFFVCDTASLVVTEQRLLTFRLQGRVTDAIKRGAFDEFDLVEDLLKPINLAISPHEDQASYPDRLWDPNVPVLIAPILARLERLLGLPVVPPPPFPPPPPPPPGMLAPPPPPPLPFSSLGTVIGTIAAERIDIEGRPSPFNDDWFDLLRKYEAAALREMASEYHRVVVTPGDPAGRLLTSVLPPNSGARGILADLRTQRTSRRNDAQANPGLAAMFRDYRAGYLGGSRALRSLDRSEERRSRSPARSSGGSDASGARTSRSKSPGPGGGVVPGSKYYTSVAHSSDEERFWYLSQDGSRASPVYDYESLEKIAGKSRAQLDFPFLLSTRPRSQRMVLCNHSHLPEHRDEYSIAHTVPFADFLAKVTEHFQEVAGDHSSRAGAKTAPTGVRGKSPHPDDARRSHGVYPGGAVDRLNPGDDRAGGHDGGSDEGGRDGRARTGRSRSPTPSPGRSKSRSRSRSPGSSRK